MHPSLSDLSLCLLVLLPLFLFYWSARPAFQTILALLPVRQSWVQPQFSSPHLVFYPSIHPSTRPPLLRTAPTVPTHDTTRLPTTNTLVLNLNPSSYITSVSSPSTILFSKVICSVFFHPFLFKRIQRSPSICTRKHRFHQLGLSRPSHTDPPSPLSRASTHTSPPPSSVSPNPSLEAVICSISPATLIAYSLVSNLAFPPRSRLSTPFNSPNFHTRPPKPMPSFLPLACGRSRARPSASYNRCTLAHVRT